MVNPAGNVALLDERDSTVTLNRDAPTNASRISLPTLPLA